MTDLITFFDNGGILAHGDRIKVEAEPGDWFLLLVDHRDKEVTVYNGRMERMVVPFRHAFLG